MFLCAAPLPMRRHQAGHFFAIASRAGSSEGDEARRAPAQHTFRWQRNAASFLPSRVVTRQPPIPLGLRCAQAVLLRSVQIPSRLSGFLLQKCGGESKTLRPSRAAFGSGGFSRSVEKNCPTLPSRRSSRSPKGNGRVTWSGLWSSNKGMTYNRPPWPPLFGVIPVRDFHLLLEHRRANLLRHAQGADRENR